MQKNLGLGARKRLEGKRASGMYYANIRRLRQKEAFLVINIPVTNAYIPLNKRERPF